MKSLSIRDAWMRNEAGQAAALIALLLFFAFLPLAALAIDGGMVYLMRRDLQNVADASALSACRVLAEGGDTATALTSAENTVATNLGAWAPYVGSNPGQMPTNVGSGEGLVQGIEVSTVETRVALRQAAPTVLTQFLGRGSTLVTAQARCNSTAGGGLMPIAVQRYDYGDTWTDYVAREGAPIYPSDSMTQTWPSPYPPGTFPVPVPLGAYTAAPDAQGPEVSLVGQHSGTNNPPNDMNGTVLLDIRNIGSSTSLEFFNGADGQADSNKSLSERWILNHGYPAPYPEVGAEVAQLSGVGARFAPQAMARAGYRPGDLVAAIIYDGYVWSTPDYEVTLQPVSGNGIVSGYPNSLDTAVQYTVKIASKGGVAWPTAMNFEMAFGLTETPAPFGTQLQLRDPTGSYHDVTNSNYTVMGVTESTPWQGTLYIFTSSAGGLITQTQRYLSGLNLFVEGSSGRQRGGQNNAKAISYGFVGAMVTPDFTVNSDSGRLAVRQGNKLNLNLYTFGSGSSCSNVPVVANIYAPDGSGPLPWNGFFSLADQNSRIAVKNNTSSKLALALVANDDAYTGSYILRLTVGSCNGYHSVDLPLEIDLMTAPGTTLNYVYIQGFAVFQITRMDSNDVWVRCISALMPRYEDIRAGLRPRLVPWN